MLARKLMRAKWPKAISLVASAFTQRTTNGTTVTIAKPAGLQVGDLMVAYCMRAGTAVTTPQWTPPSGWTEADDAQGRCVAWIVATSTEVAASDFTFTCATSATNSGYIFAFRNANFGATTVATAPSGTYPQTITGLSAGNQSMALFFSSQAFYGGISWTLSTSGWTSLASDSDGTAGSSATFYKTVGVEGATGSVTISAVTNNRQTSSNIVVLNTV